MSGVFKRSVTIGGHRTSISLETAFSDELERIAAERGASISALIAEIDAARDPATNLSSAIRLFVLADLKARTLAPDSVE
ncbi:ribbon-helix-helix domain-containing protein [Tianweitania sp. BSSL-BM11]|uniref:Ribbon-helix-helix domain-containing protein n=1 Tax=Tianweitania aestuarii TaxID=2814886 RepID=A0ABS5RV07_9HYPH|nr:ribbon-helix-helix domain-containing protein [Tianweitania aestuarii]MBS9720883.1 ribbon-helix-helix domain-containing protein [Tianweitania aestuarii]